jgi:hypothetical protein
MAPAVDDGILATLIFASGTLTMRLCRKCVLLTSCENGLRRGDKAHSVVMQGRIILAETISEISRRREWHDYAGKSRESRAHEDHI